MKISEFNYKLQHGILPTKCNLFKQMKSKYTQCIYCKYITHDAKHLLFDCPSICNILHITGNVLDLEIRWEEIVIGTTKTVSNKIISLFSYIIYKKYLIDKDNGNVQYNFFQFLDKDVNLRLQEYTLSVCDLSSTITLRNILDCVKDF